MSLDKGMSQMHNTEMAQDVPSKPVGKTTTKTEVSHVQSFFFSITHA